MKVIRWDHYDYDDKSGSQKGYCELDDPNPQETYMNLCNEIRKHGYKFDGPYHQDGKMGTPVLEGDLYMLFSYRSWGGVMADAWSSVDKVSYNYMDFYMMDQYSDEFKTPEYELPGFVKPERPVVTHPVDHIQRFFIASNCTRVQKCIPKLEKAVNEIKKIADTQHDRLFNEAVLNVKLRLVDLEAEITKLQDGCTELLRIQKEFYEQNPQYDPDGIATLTSSDGKSKVRVYPPYAKLTYEEVMEKFPANTCTDNQLEQVFPDWNRFEGGFTKNA